MPAQWDSAGQAEARALAEQFKKDVLVQFIVEHAHKHVSKAALRTAEFKVNGDTISDQMFEMLNAFRENDMLDQGDLDQIANLKRTIESKWRALEEKADQQLQLFNPDLLTGKEMGFKLERSTETD